MSMPETDPQTKDYRAGKTAEPALSLVYCTFPTMEIAKSVAGPLIAQRLAACVNLIPGMVAIYEWEEALHEDPEVVAVIKTRAELVERLFAAIAAHHPYANPALISFDVASSAPAYSDWVIDQTRHPVSGGI